MQLRQYLIDSFTAQPFRGNPAAVVPLEEWLPEATMQAIAAENNLSETAFFVPEGDRFSIRWFTPATEVDLCGHATLATAFVAFRELGIQSKKVTFHSKYGPLAVFAKENGMLELDFPSCPPARIEIPNGLEQAVGSKVLEAYMSRDLVAVLEDELAVQKMMPDHEALKHFDGTGVLVTARGSTTDFVSRCFFPKEGIPEDPVTGSAHCTLAPLWSAKLGKSSLRARQLSQRQGDLWCVIKNDRVVIAGYAVKVAETTLFIPDPLSKSGS